MLDFCDGEPVTHKLCYETNATQPECEEAQKKSQNPALMFRMTTT